MQLHLSSLLIQGAGNQAGVYAGASSQLSVAAICHVYSAGNWADTSGMQVQVSQYTMSDVAQLPAQSSEACYSCIV